MIMSEKSKQHVDACRFCWMCHHVCPIGNATGQERNTARARALGISLVNREAIDLSEIMDNIYFYPPAQHAYQCSICGRSCDISCYMHLEKKGVLSKSFKTPFRKRDEWSFDIEDFK